MSITSDLIKKKEERNQLLEKSADKALLEDKRQVNLNMDLDAVQAALLYILDRFKLPANRIFAYYSTDDLVQRIMEPNNVMYRKTDDLASGFFQFLDASDSRFDVAGIGLGHGLYGDGCITADKNVTDM